MQSPHYTDGKTGAQREEGTLLLSQLFGDGAPRPGSPPYASLSLYLAGSVFTLRAASGGHWVLSRRESAAFKDTHCPT